MFAQMVLVSSPSLLPCPYILNNVISRTTTRDNLETHWEPIWPHKILQNIDARLTSMKAQTKVCKYAVLPEPSHTQTDGSSVAQW